MRIPIIILAFDRPDYLRQVLESLRRQADIGDYHVALFLDGAYDLFNDRMIADAARIDACADVFREMFPNGTLVDSERNLGIAGNFLRAERYAFEMLAAPYAYFLEDDMILGPGYLKILADLASWGAYEPAISTFAAYGPHNDDLPTQAAHAGSLTRMIWNWAFGLSRAHWVSRHQLMRPYYDMVLSGPYRERPHAAIVQWCRTLGWGMISPTVHPAAASSQDSVKTAMSSALGASGLMTRTVHAKYIGEVGTHFNPGAYASHHFADTALYDGIPPRIERPPLPDLRSYAFASHGMRELGDKLPEKLIEMGRAESADLLAKAFGLADLSGIAVSDLQDLELPIPTLRARYPQIDAVVRKRRQELADLLIPLVNSLALRSITTVDEVARRSGVCFYLPVEMLEADYAGHKPAAPLELLECRWPAAGAGSAADAFIARAFDLLAGGGSLDLLVPEAEMPDASAALSRFNARQIKSAGGYQTYRLARP